MARNPEATTLTLVRHTRTTATEEGKVAGDWDVDISSGGEQLARERGVIFRARPIDAVYSTIKKRGVRTAELLTGRPRTEIKQTGLLVERNYASLEGDKPPEEVKKDLEVLLGFWRTDFSERRDVRPVAGMETDRELLERWEQFKQEIITEHPGEHVLAVSHCDFIGTVLKSKGLCLSSRIGGIVTTGFVDLTSDPAAKRPTFRVDKINGLIRRRAS